MSNFYFSGLDPNRWFGNNFEEFHLFGFVGDRERLMEELSRKSWLRRVIEIFAPKINIGSILNGLANIELLSVDPDKTIATQVINLVTEYENQRRLNELLEQIYKTGKKKGTYFEKVSLKGSNSVNSLQGKLVTVEGHLLHRSTIDQYSLNTSATLRSSEGNWLLSDYPPNGLLSENSRYLGKLLLLTEDQGFTKVFQHLLPFCSDIGWYPYVRITGFLDFSRLYTEIHPSLSICLVEYRRPRLIEEVEDSIADLLDKELHSYSGRRNFLSDWEDLVLFSFLLPIVYKGSNKLPKEASPHLTELVGEYLSLCNSDLPKSLRAFYDNFGTSA